MGLTIQQTCKLLINSKTLTPKPLATPFDQYQNHPKLSTLLTNNKTEIETTTKQTQ